MVVMLVLMPAEQSTLLHDKHLLPLRNSESLKVLPC